MKIASIPVAGKRQRLLQALCGGSGNASRILCDALGLDDPLVDLDDESAAINQK